MDFLRICKERGYFHQCTDEAGLHAYLNGNENSGTRAPAVAYIGFDCTAKSLHVGSLLQIMLLRWFQKCGHKPIVLMGGGTTKVGDPTGKDKSRQLLTDADIQENMDSLQQVFQQFITFGDGPTDAIMVNNADWLDSLEYIPFLREYGRHFSVNRMLSMESVKQRLSRESHLSFLEFNYMILQSFDFVKLNEWHGCRVQFGGSDQWGNIVMGVELNRRAAEDTTELYGMTSPLITTASGGKMGKTAEGAVWLNSAMTSPYDYWQFWRNTEDADVGRFLRIFTELPLEEIQKLESAEGAGINDAKKVLATEATKLLHGEEAARQAEDTARQTFEQGAVGGALPEFSVDRGELEAGIPAFKLLQTAELAESGKKARNLIKQGGVKVNDAPVQTEDQPISLSDMTAEGYIKLSAGKKRHALIKAA
tara:strand:+ start:1289 stop:2554 length:1266 start_codon:yes stop_codon:yes gene_type:complete